MISQPQNLSEGKVVVSPPQSGITEPNRRKHRGGRLAGAALCYLLMALLILWASLALYLDFSIPRLRIVATIVYLAVNLDVLLLVKCAWRRILAALVCFLCVLAWWLSLKPSNDEPWQGDVSKTAWADINGNQVTLHNFRSCDYRAELDYNCLWLTRTVDLNQIRGLDLFMNYWGSPWIAHTILSFDIGGGKHVAFSIETRKRTGQTYSALRGFFRQYTLILVVSDERDVVRVRTNYRQGEDLYLFHTTASPAFARGLFLNYIAMTNEFHDKPRWYNAVTHNCTTEIYALSTMKDQPLDWRILLNGKADQMEYERGALAGNLPWAQLKQQAHINAAARAANDDPDFSSRIRMDRPGFPRAREVSRPSELVGKP